VSALIVLVALPFLASLANTALPAKARNAASVLSSLAALAGLIILIYLWPQVEAGTVLRHELPWLPQLGINLVLRLDGLAWMLAMLVLGIGWLVVVYARYYMSPGDPVVRFHAFLLAFMGAMMGVALSGNLVQLVFFWELTGLFSFMLIGYWHHRADARLGARTALLVTGSGGLALLVGVLMIGTMVGSLDLDVVLASGDALRNHPWYLPMLVLVLLGAFTKSAQFPFHWWLPRAMAAPTPVSAYLHSATMVKLGVFLLARLWPVLAGTEEWLWLVGGAGLVTLLVGALLAIVQNDLKGLLAYSTISNLGLIMLLLGLNSKTAAVAAVFHMLNHAAFKASLFMAAGIIDHETGTRDLRRLSGLFKPMPYTGTLAIVSSAAMAGVPLLNGFLSKEMFFTETLYLESKPWINLVLSTAAVFAATCAVVYSLRVAHGVFFGPPPAADLPRQPHEPVRWMRLPIDLLVIICLVVGVAPNWAIGPVLATAARPVVGGVLPPYTLAVWHGFTTALMMSFVAMTAGVVVYVWLRRRMLAQRHLARPPLHGMSLFRASLVHTVRAARWLMRRLMAPRVQRQLAAIVAVAALAGWLAFGGEGLAWGSRPRVAASPEFALLWVVGCGCALGAAWQAKYHRLAALTMLSGAGLMVCLTFVWFSAPDLALTQLVVEVVTLVLYLLGLRWLPKRLETVRPLPTVQSMSRRSRDLLLAAAVGVGLAVLSYAMLTRPVPAHSAPFFLAQAVPGGGGANVVNVMLVDFRGFDTFGEIVVLVIVALTVFALLRRFRPPVEAQQVPPQQRCDAPPLAPATEQTTGARVGRIPQGYLMGPTVLAGVLFPVMLVAAAHFFLRGHNEPGGGFVAGLLVAIAFITQYMVAGAEAVESRVGLHPMRWMGAGLLIACATGLGSLLLGYPFMTTHTAHLHLPLLGDVHVPSAMFFDMGVFAAVVGSTLLILLALAHQSIRARKQVD